MGALLFTTVTTVACAKADDVSTGGGGRPASGGVGGMSGTGGTSCQMTYAPDPRDATMTGELVKLDVGNGRYDVELPQEMVDWLLERNWVQAHGDWHSVRRWDQQCGGHTAGCPAIEEMLARGLQRSPIQEGQAGDGYAFLVMHRHMIEGFKQAFPEHAQLISGFTAVPMSKDDPQNPVPWVDVKWSDTQEADIALLQDIEDNLSAFAGEDDLGLWIQYAVGGVGGMGSTGVQYDGKGRPLGGIHAGLHGQWRVAGSPYPLTDNNTNLRLHAFWRLHGWIDSMWERYRKAKGITASDPAYLAEMEDQCEEMVTLGRAEPRSDADGGTAEQGTFAMAVTPIFKSYCSGCHDNSAPSGGLVLSGTSASAIRAGLVGVPAAEASMKLVEPGAPDESWLVRKLEGDFGGIQCQTACQTQMPPAGAAPSAADIAAIRAWISAGAGAN